MFVGLTVDCY